MLTLPEQSANAQRVDELRARRDRLEQDIATADREYARALRNPRCSGLDEAGAKLMRLAAAADAVSREIRRLEA